MNLISNILPSGKIQQATIVARQSNAIAYAMIAQAVVEPNIFPSVGTKHLEIKKQHEILGISTLMVFRQVSICPNISRVNPTLITPGFHKRVLRSYKSASKKDRKKKLIDIFI